MDVYSQKYFSEPKRPKWKKPKKTGKNIGKLGLFSRLLTFFRFPLHSPLKISRNFRSEKNLFLERSKDKKISVSRSEKICFARRIRAFLFFLIR